VHHYLLNEREASAARQTYSSARVMERVLEHAGTDVGDALSSLSVAQGTVALLYQHGKWYSASVSVGESTGTSRPASLPSALVQMVTKGTAARQRVVVDGQLSVAVGVPLAGVGADFFEIQSLTELASTLDLLAVVLLICAVATTLGGAVIGRWASGRLMRPLRRITDVAAAISSGALDQRLPPTNDPDLAVLAITFNNMVQALEERIKRDARFASDVSHELRSPLTTVQATLELLEASEANLGVDGRKALGLLGAEIRRFSAMVQDLLEISRFDAGAANLDLDDLALDDLVVNTVAAYKGTTVPVVVTRAAAGVWLYGDRRRLQRVLVNLLDNAQAYAGGAIRVTVDRHGDEAEVTVEDAGPGVPSGERAAIFERFYRGAASGRREAGSGTGLGLALVAEHVKAHEGRVEVLGRAGGGARFVVYLPVTSRMTSDDA
jgi:signal transduction histidine kinase